MFSQNNNIKPNEEKNNNLKPSPNLSNFDNDFSTDMFAAFDTHFTNQKSTNKTYSAFGDPVSTTTGSEFVANFDDVFKNNFEDEFSAMNIVNNGNVKKVDDRNFNLDNFSRYGEKQDNTRVRNVLKKGGDKVSDKLVADFSKSDNYDKDLEEALQRSLVDQ